MRDRNIRGLAIVLGLAFLSVMMTYVGMNTLREQHSGAPAQITVDECSTGSLVTCWGVWPLAAGGGASKIEIHGTSRSDIGKQIGVHVHDNRYAVADASSYPIYEVGMGLGFAIAAVTVLVLRRERMEWADQACHEDQPSTVIFTTGPVNEIRSY